MSNNRKDWISHIVEKTAEKHNNRTVVLWGAYETSYLINKLLKEKHNIGVGFFVDGDSSKVDEEIVFPVSKLKGKNKEYFIIIPIAFYQSLKNILIEYGYTTDDYYYFCDCIVTKTEDYYEDSHGNKIIGNFRNTKLVLTGFDALVTIGKGFNSQPGTVVYIHSNVKVSFGDGCKLNGTFHLGKDSTVKIGNNFETSNNTLLYVEGNANLLVGNDCKCSIDFDTHTSINLSSGSRVNWGDNNKISGSFIVRNNAKLKIGDNLTINKNLHLSVLDQTELVVGDDCMFSHDLTFYTNDSHSIFDIQTGQNLNSTEEINSERKIIIGNHVWIGARSIILYNTRIGDGSVIGAGSIVKNKIPNNCIAVGTPARIVRRNIAWSRDNCSENIVDCGNEYVHMTEEARI